jgi:membrane-associated protein
VLRAENFYDKYGAKTLLIAHFVPVIRTFTPLLAGVAKMPYKRFLSFDAIGDTTWAIVIGLVGYYVGSRIPNIDRYILLAVGFVIVATLLPTIYQIVRLQLAKRARDKLRATQSEDKTQK